MLSLLFMLSAAFAAPPKVTGADHQGVYSGAEVAWLSRYWLDGDQGGTLDFVAPLPADVSVEGPARLVAGDGGFTALEVPVGLRTFSLSLRHPIDPADGGAQTLYPPLLESTTPQLLRLDGVAFAPSKALGLEQHLRYAAHPEIDRLGRKDLDHRSSGRRARAHEHPIYLIADERLSGGLSGELSPVGAVADRVTLAIAALFALGVGGLAFAIKLLAPKAREEELDAYIRKEFSRPAASMPQADACEAPTE